MYCPKCGKENPDGTQVCQYCGCEFSGFFVAAKPRDVRTSSFAIASFLCGNLSPILLALTVLLNRLALGIVDLGIVISAVLFGIIGLVHIGTSGGKIVGKGLAAIGIVIPTVLLTIIFLPALFARPRMTAFRMVCGSNLSGIGKAMLIYSNDYDDKLPRAGGKESVWAAKINDWKAPDRRTAFNLNPDGSGGQASISSSFFLLVKYAEVTPKSFVCKKDSGTTEFKLSEETLLQPAFELIDAWDFGPNPPKHCSYAYHIPYGPYSLTTSGEPGMAVAADRNPWIPSPFVKAQKDFGKFDPNGTPERQKYGNCVPHEGDGQNVLFLDGSVRFEKRSYCAIDDDNIYTFWAGPSPNWDKRKGIPPQIGSQPKDRLDSLLVNDPPTEVEKPKRSWWPWRR
jgi:prepilin-type processing-associated H-X9-DG protein